MSLAPAIPMGVPLRSFPASYERTNERTENFLSYFQPNHGSEVTRARQSASTTTRGMTA